MSTKTQIALVDDHTLLRKGMVEVVNKFQHFQVNIEAENGVDFTNQLHENNLPEIVILDISMPKMDGFETAKYLKENYPKIKVLVLSMFNQDQIIIRMIKLGAIGYVLKDAHPQELEAALTMIQTQGFYYSSNIVAAMLNGGLTLDSIEIEFLCLVCKEFTYKEIADKLKMTDKQVDKLRESMFKKLGVKCKVGLAMYAIRNKICDIN